MRGCRRKRLAKMARIGGRARMITFFALPASRRVAAWPQAKRDLDDAAMENSARSAQPLDGVS